MFMVSRLMGAGHNTVHKTAVSASDHSCSHYLQLSLDALQTARQYLQLPQSDENRANNNLASSSSNSPVGGINFYRCQCEVMIEYLIHIQKRLRHIADGNIPSEIKRGRRPEPEWPMQALRELYRVLTNAANLIRDCCNQPSCLKAALRQALVRSQDFAEICREIVWWTSVMYFYNNIRHVEQPSIEVESFPQAEMDYENQFMLEKAAEDDLKSVMGEVEKWSEGHTCSAEVCGNNHQNRDFCLAAQVLRRWDGSGGILARNEALAAREVDHESLLWNFDKEIVLTGSSVFLGGGAFGWVMQVTWLGDKYALKNFSKNGRFSLPDEASALARLTHPHIVRVLAYSEDSLLMDLMPTDLLKYITARVKKGEKPPFSLRAAIDLMLQVADAMRYLHSQKIVHRDLKSGNILVSPVDVPGLGSEEGFVFAKIANFGLAKTKREITSYSHLTKNIGSRFWMAPEIFDVSNEDMHLTEAYPMKADVYSFGIVCSEILSGEQPFHDLQPMSGLYKRLVAPDHLRPPLPPSCPENLAALIKRCWDTDPRERPDFTDICKMLRYLKGLQMTGIAEDELHERQVVSPFKKLLQVNQKVSQMIVKMQGPWGMWKLNPTYFYESADRIAETRNYFGPDIGICSIKLFYYDTGRHYLSAFQAKYHIRGKPIEADRHGMDFRNNACDQVTFEYPTEYLVQVKGSFTTNTQKVFCDYHGGPFMTALVFVTNHGRILGPYGNYSADGLMAFATEPSKVVGFFGISGHLLEDFGVLTTGDTGPRRQIRQGGILEH